MGVLLSSCGPWACCCHASLVVVEKPIKGRTCFKNVTSLPLAAGSDLRLRFPLDSVLVPAPQDLVQAVHPLLGHL